MMLSRLDPFVIAPQNFWLRTILRSTTNKLMCMLPICRKLIFPPKIFMQIFFWNNSLGNGTHLLFVTCCCCFFWLTIFSPTARCGHTITSLQPFRPFKKPFWGILIYCEWLVFFKMWPCCCCSISIAFAVVIARACPTSPIRNTPSYTWHACMKNPQNGPASIQYAENFMWCSQKCIFLSF